MQTVQGNRAARAARIAERQQRSDRRKWQLARRLTDPVKLVACLSFYMNRLRRPGTPKLAEPIDAELKARGRSWKPYGRAVRRALGVKYIDNRRLMRLPKNVWDVRLPWIGLALRFKPAQLGRFKALPADLTINAAVQSFAADYPQLLEKVKLRLEDRYRPTRRESLGLPELIDDPEARKAVDRAAQKKAQFWITGDDAEPETHQQLSDALSAKPGPLAHNQFNGEQRHELKQRLEEDAKETDRIIAASAGFTGFKHSTEDELWKAPDTHDGIESPFKQPEGKVLPAGWEGREELLEAYRLLQIAEYTGDLAEDDPEEEEDERASAVQSTTRKRYSRADDVPYVPPEPSNSVTMDCIGAWLEKRRARDKEPEPQTTITFNWFQAPVSRPAPLVFPNQIPQEQLLMARVAAFLRQKAG